VGTPHSRIFDKIVYEVRSMRIAPSVCEVLHVPCLPLPPPDFRLPPLAAPTPIAATEQAKSNLNYEKKFFHVNIKIYFVF
jgi:hypothetical protein